VLWSTCWREDLDFVSGQGCSETGGPGHVNKNRPSAAVLRLRWVDSGRARKGMRGRKLGEIELPSDFRSYRRERPGGPRKELPMGAGQSRGPSPVRRGAGEREFVSAISLAQGAGSRYGPSTRGPPGNGPVCGALTGGAPSEAASAPDRSPEPARSKFLWAGRACLGVMRLDTGCLARVRDAEWRAGVALWFECGSPCGRVRPGASPLILSARDDWWWCFVGPASL